MSENLDKFGELVRQKRGRIGVRSAAAEIGMSSSTLSRIENGQVPDLETFIKVCDWMDTDPALFLGRREESDSPIVASVHFRKKRTLPKKTATALANLIIAAHAGLQSRNKV